MRGPRIANACISILVLVPPVPLAACDVPSKLLAGRTLSETRKVPVKDKVEVRFRVLVGEAE
jgi:hypothetical protein